MATVHARVPAEQLPVKSSSRSHSRLQTKDSHLSNPCSCWSSNLPWRELKNSAMPALRWNTCPSLQSRVGLSIVSNRAQPFAPLGIPGLVKNSKSKREIVSLLTSREPSPMQPADQLLCSSFFRPCQSQPGQFYQENKPRQHSSQAFRRGIFFPGSHRTLVQVAAPAARIGFQSPQNAAENDGSLRGGHESEAFLESPPEALGGSSLTSSASSGRQDGHVQPATGGTLAWLLAAGALAVGGAFLFVQTFLRGASLPGKYQAVIEFPRAWGIIVGTPVRVRGCSVGSVVAVRPTLTAVDALVEIEEGKVTIPRRSEVKVNRSGLVAETFIDITPPDKVPEHEFGPLDEGCKRERVIVCDQERIRGEEGVSIDELVGLWVKLSREGERQRALRMRRS